MSKLYGLFRFTAAILTLDRCINNGSGHHGTVQGGSTARRLRR